jgi:hypothetical protein
MSSVSPVVLRAGRAVFGAVYVIAEGLKTLADDCPRASGVVSREVTYILKQNVRRSPTTEDLDDLMKQRALGSVTDTSLGPRLGERLARESGAENLVWGDVSSRRPNVTGDRRSRTVIALIKSSKVVIEFGGEDARVTGPGECQVEASESCEKVDEPHLCT